MTKNLIPKENKEQVEEVRELKTKFLLMRKTNERAKSYDAEEEI